MGGENRETPDRVKEENKPGKKKEQKRAGGKLAAVCRVTGTLLILAVILLCSALVLPGIFGWHMYHVISGSMEPALSVGSLIYIYEDPPEDVKEDDIIAFYAVSEEARLPEEDASGDVPGYGSPDDNSIITHRVVKNNVVSGNFRTKGDANDSEDPMAADYDFYIGRVKLAVPYMGAVLTVMTSLEGKFAAVCVVLAGVLLNLAGSSGKSDEEFD